ncbi:hypothetical protein EYD00_21900 [Agrobacterium sp. 33MFTa1.1]|uniref:hypothetical protein n=1 Tax=Agrobacterium sp. 33MFTa1.1 TaxID=1279031 RepID=UPI00054E5F06|nr:hypothetical protein [Agrobacterium sp. 33MFTa1.1]QBJ16045.1 hypothetical protein EYD00_21900 [Agrobacterium sp. 33MFTa1.1]
MAFSVTSASGADELRAAPATVVGADWAFQATGYLWATGLNGNISPFRRAPTLHVEKSFSDVMEDLNFGGFLNIWGRYDRFVLSGDLMYVDTTDSKAAGPLPALQIPSLPTLPAGAAIDADVDTQEFMATLQAGYRIVDADGFSLDALAGARFWHISNEVTVTASHPLIGSVSATHKESFGWIDPVIGARAFFSLTDKLSVQGQVDIGGFGAGSDLTWSALATMNYIFTDSLSVSAGYKVLDVDYSDEGYVFDSRLSGPVLGLTYRF